MRPIPVLPFMGGISSFIAAAETAFNLAITRQPPQLPPMSTGGRAAPATFTPVTLPPLQIKTADTDQAQRPPLLLLGGQKSPQGQPAHPDAEKARVDVFEHGNGFYQVGKKRGMNEEQLVKVLDDAAGVTVHTAKNNIGIQTEIVDAKSGKTITIIHDQEKGTDSISVEDSAHTRSSRSVDGNGVITESSYDPKTGIAKTHVEDPKAGTVTDVTRPRNGPTREVTTDSGGKKTVKVIGGEYTTTTAPDGKVTITDHATGTEVVLEKLTYAEALKRDKKLAGDIDAASKAATAAQKKLTDAGVTPEMAANLQDPAKLKPHQVTPYKEHVEAQANLNKLLAERRVLVAQFEVSLTEPNTKERHAAINGLLDAADLQKNVTAYDDANVKLAKAAVSLSEANGDLARYDIFKEAVAAYRNPDTEHLFDPNGYNVYSRTVFDGGPTGKLLKQEVIYKGGHLYLRNTYENEVFDGDESNILEIQLTLDPGERRNATAAEKQVDAKWHTAREPFSYICREGDAGWRDTINRQSQAEKDYGSAKGARDSIVRANIDQAIPDLQKVYNDAVKKHGSGSTEKPTGPAAKGEEPVQIQVGDDLRWVHPEVAAAYLALRTAQEQSAGLDVQIREAHKDVKWIELKQENSGPLLASLAPNFEDDLWSKNSDAQLRTDDDLNKARDHYGDLRSDRVQTQIGIENANIAAWNRDHPKLAARLATLEKDRKAAGDTTFIGPLAPGQAAPQNQTVVQINSILRSDEARPLADARERVGQLQEEKGQVQDFRSATETEKQWIDKLQSMPVEERRDKDKRDELHLDFVGNHAQEFSHPAQKLQRELGGPIVGRDDDPVRAMVQKAASGMQQAGMEIDVEHVVSQILRSPQINGDDPDSAGDLKVKPIAMQYEQAGTSMTTGVFQVTNQQGKTFLVDLKGQIWGSQQEFLDNNKLYSDKGILLMPKNFDTTNPEYEAKAARNLSWAEEWFDPIVGGVTFIATIGSFIPGVNLVAAPVALIGGGYLGVKAGINQYQHVKHGGSWRDGESVMNMLTVTATAAPALSSILRTGGLAVRGVPLKGAMSYSIGASQRSANYFARADYLSRASLFGRQGYMPMRLARMTDGIALGAGVPLTVVAGRDLAYLDQMSGLERANAILNFVGGVFGTGMGAAGLRATRAGRSERIRVEDAPPVAPDDANPPAARPRPFARLFGRTGDGAANEPAVRGNPRPDAVVPAHAVAAPDSAAEAAPAANVADPAEQALPAILRQASAGDDQHGNGRNVDSSQNTGRGTDRQRPLAHVSKKKGGNDDTAPHGAARSPEGNEPIGPTSGDARRGTPAMRPLTEAEIARNHQEASDILTRLTGGVRTLNGVRTLRVPQLADLASRSPTLMELLRTADANDVRIINSWWNRLRLLNEHHFADTEYDADVKLVSLRSDEAHERAMAANSGPEGYLAELASDLAHELVHVVHQYEDVAASDAPAGLRGYEAFEAAYVNMRLREEGAARLTEFAVAEELRLNGRLSAPSLGRPGRSDEAEVFALFQEGIWGWREASLEAGERAAADPEVTYREDFVEEAQEVWSGNPDIRDEFNAIPHDGGEADGQPRSLSAAYHPAWEPLPRQESSIPPALRKPEMRLPLDPLQPYRPGDPSQLSFASPRAEAPGLSNPRLLANLDPDVVQADLIAAGVSERTARAVADQIRDPSAASLRIEPPFDTAAAIRNAKLSPLTNKEVAKLTEAELRSDVELAEFSARQLRALTGEQVAVITEEQRSTLSDDQIAALEAPRVEGFRRGLRALATEARETGLSYGGFLLGSGISSWLLMKYGWFDPVNYGAYGLRGASFIIQASLPQRLVGPDTKAGRIFSIIYAGTSMPNVVDSLGNTPAQPLVYGPFAAGIMPFGAVAFKHAVTGRMPDAPLGYHFGYAGYTAGSAFYIHPAFHGTTAVPGWMEPSAAFLFLSGSIELWAGHLIRNRRANQDSPMPGSQRGRMDDAIDRFLPGRGLVSDRAVAGADRAGLGIAYGAGLLLFSAVGLKGLWDKRQETKQGADGRQEPPIIQPPEIPPQPPERPEPPKPPVDRPHIVTVERWRPGGGSADNSTLWDIAGNNLPTLLTPQQKAQVERDGLSLRDDRSALVADLGLPRLIDLNPQYPLAENPDLIHPGWRLNVG